MPLSDSTFRFRSARKQPVSATDWVNEWSVQFPTKKYSEKVYRQLLRLGAELDEGDVEILGAWKDGALSVPPAPDSAARLFGGVAVSFNRKWSPAAWSCAYEAWQRLKGCLPNLRDLLARKKIEDFLGPLAKLAYERGRGKAHLGLSRATYVLHIFSEGRFPIYDKWTHRGTYLLVGGRYGAVTIGKNKSSDVTFYLKTWYPMIEELQHVCNATDRQLQREVDKALFAYGRAF